MRKIPELLAPVGGEEQLRAAVENGADAVYMGGRAFHARVNAGSFGGESLRQAVRYAHSKGVRVYITLNTLVTDEEFEEAVAEAAECCAAGVDALIVQDFGLAGELRRRLPQMELHLSTQGTVYDLQGVKKAQELGFSQVVLARETSFAQIETIASKTDVPLEVFVHGALCMCYSGQCQMSRFQGGRSGNRGGCAQPCRLPYELVKDGKIAAGQKNGLGPYRLSPKDMCTIDHIGRLADIGVASLKIEGRMKSPEYVAAVTGIYRKYLDLYAKNGEYQVSPEDRLALLQIFNRGGFTDGYLWENPRREILSGRIPKHQGILAGTVLGVRTAGEGKAVRQFLTVKLAEELCLGDGVEARGTQISDRERPAGNIVTYIGEPAGRGKRNGRSGKSLRRATAGSTVEIGDIPGTVHPGDRLYRMSSKEQLKQARQTFTLASGLEKKEGRKLPVDMTLYMREGAPVTLTVTQVEEGQTGDPLSVTVSSEQPAEQALHRPMDEETARRQLEKTGDTMFALRRLKLMGEEGLTVRTSELNRLRRDGLERLTELWEGEQNGRDCTVLPPAEEEAHSLSAAQGGRLSYYLFRGEEEVIQRAKGVKWDRLYLPYKAFLQEALRQQIEELAAGGRQVFAWLPPVTQGREEAFLAEHRESLIAILRSIPQAALTVNNLGQIRMFQDCGLKLYGDYGLNLYNSADFAWAKRQGLCGAVLGHEAFDNGFDQPMKELPRLSGIEGEAAVAGRIPLMISAHCPIGDATGCRGDGDCLRGRYALRDRKGRNYPILTELSDCRTMIFSEDFRRRSPADEKALTAAGYDLRIYGIDSAIFE